MASAAAAQEPCASTPGYDRLDFWLGEWDVFSGERKVGTNRIGKILDGCAITEEWAGAGGGEGRSLFYFVPTTGEWKQVWVTDTATRTGGVKEKVLIGATDGGGLQFQGRILDGAGEAWYDRTTLTPLPSGDVRQLIEISQDSASWQTIFDAVYRRSGAW